MAILSDVKDIDIVEHYRSLRIFNYEFFIISYRQHRSTGIVPRSVHSFGKRDLSVAATASCSAQDPYGRNIWFTQSSSRPKRGKIKFKASG